MWKAGRKKATSRLGNLPTLENNHKTHLSAILQCQPFPFKFPWFYHWNYFLCISFSSFFTFQYQVNSVSLQSLSFIILHTKVQIVKTNYTPIKVWTVTSDTYVIHRAFIYSSVLIPLLFSLVPSSLKVIRMGSWLPF